MKRHARLGAAGTLCCAALLIAAGIADAVTARDILGAAGVRGGLIVHVGCGEGKLTAELGAGEGCVVHGLAAEAQGVAAARAYVQSKGLYGKVSIDRLPAGRLPYVDGLVNLVVVSKADAGVPTEEILRVLAPNGVAYVRKASGWTKTVKPRPEAIDEWTHYLHDASGNAVAADDRVGPPKHMQWRCGPRYSRSHEFNPSINAFVTGAGRLFYIVDEGLIGLPDSPQFRFPSRWSLVARDAFSGVKLWKRRVPNWGYRQWNTVGLWSAPLTLQRRLVSDGRHVFVTLGYKAPVSVLDAATGRTLRTLEGTMGTDEIVCADGVLLLCVRRQLSVASPPKKKPPRRRNPHEWNVGVPGPAAIVALDAASGRPLWKRTPQEITILTLAAAGGRVCFSDRQKIFCLDLKTGQQRWAVPCRGPRNSRHAGGTLVIHDGVVLFTGAKGLAAFDAETGKELWTGPRVQGPGVAHPPDLFVADGLVWGGDVAGTHRRERTAVKRQGRDLKTGEVKRTVEVPYLISPMHHFRCYRSKATDRYILLTKRGVEFLDLKGKDHMRCDWLRATCSYGFVPANGLLYAPSHQCFCYPGVKLAGFNALAARRKMGAEPQAPTDPVRLERGPALAERRRAKAASAKNPQSAIRNPQSEDWPTYRRDAQRSGHAPSPAPVDVDVLWQAKLGGRLTPPVLAGGRLFVAQKDAHRLCCADAASGEIEWTYTAGGRIDSPPTAHKGTVLFGCRDGRVYCLRAADGELVWRFRAAPLDRRVVAHDQVESAWPCHGSVLVLDDVVYCTAGRSSFLDGGIHLYGLDAASGKALHHAVVSGPWPDVFKDKGRPFDIEGSRSDVLVSDGRHIYLYQMVFDRRLKRVPAPRMSKLGDRRMGLHLLSTNGFVDDTWFDRTYWAYWRRWPGYYFTNSGPKAGQILVFDDSTVYGLHVFTRRDRLSPVFTPGKQGYKLFADDESNEPVLTERHINREKGPGYSRAKPPKWAVHVPVRARAMVLAGKRLFLAGPPDVVPADDPYAAFDGRLGGRLWVVAAEDGKKLGERKLDALPAFDGLIAAAGRLYMTTEDGRLLCLGGK